MLKYTKDHEWLRIEGDIATVGITNHAQEAMGDVVFVELPDVGKALEQGKEAATVESVKAASEVYAPVDGAVTEINAELVQEPGKVNQEAESGAWFFKMRLSTPAQLDALLDEAAYKAFVESQG